jgi:hypothetical protein
MRIFCLLIVMLSTGLCFSQNNSPYRIFFTTQSAKIDTLNDVDQDSTDEITPFTYTVTIDLNGDGVPEKFIADGNMCGSGGCPWIIYDGKTNSVLGEVDGIIVYILKKKQNGFPLIETYWKLGGSNATVYYYTFINKKYKKVRGKSLDEQGMEEYFDTKPPIVDEFKELH